jgi:hypothetical protein
MSARDFERMAFPVWRRARISLFRQLENLLRVWRVLKLCCRNLAGHIEILLSKNEYDYGPLAEVDPSGALCWNRRTNARVAGIRELKSLYPWASNIEEKIFLAGFDKGEQFVLHLADTPLVEIPASTWFDPTSTRPVNGQRPSSRR